MSRIRISKKNLFWTLIVIVSLFIAGLRIIILVTERTDDKEQLLVPSDQDKTINHLLIDEINAARKHAYGIIHERKLPCLVIAVSIRDKIVWSEAFGYANLEKKQLVSTDARFRINSVSKLFTAALAARLYEQGKLDFDRDIRGYLPDFPDKGYSITARQLASHRSGIRSYRDDLEALQTKHYDNVLQSLELFSHDNLIFKPGTNFLYSGYGYVLLSAVLEKAGNGNFLQLMQNEVFAPLHMGHTRPAINAEITGEATCYDNVSPYSSDGSIVVSPPNDFSFKWAAGGFVSTAGDIVRFGNAHINSLHHNFLEKHSLDQLFKPQTMQMGLLGYGMGWMSARDPHLRKAYFHFGAGSGGTSLLAIYPNQELSIALLTNLGHAKLPYSRIMGIVNSFQPSPTKIIFKAWLALAILWLLFVLYRYYSNLF